MNVGVLFSGGKDSCLALQRARQYHDVVCLISLISLNKESYMFHVPNIEITELQANAIGLPLIQKRTKGEKEEELLDLKEAIEHAKVKYYIKGVVTGAIRSVYQASRIQRVCNELGLWCFNPLWLNDEIEVLQEVVEKGFKVLISGVFAYPLERKHLGLIMDKDIITELSLLHKKYNLNPAGEGGELETTVLDAPFFKKTIEVIDYVIHYRDHSGVFEIKEARFVDK
ncbi:MAG: diphthine--ammonia ligase [Nitrososphaeria archaeon]